MIIPLYFLERVLYVGFNITPESHHIIRTNFKIFIKQNYPDFGIEIRFVNKIKNNYKFFYARLINQCKFQYQTVFSTRYDKQDEDNQVLDETELFINLNINHNLKGSDLVKMDVRSPLEHQIQQQET